MPSASAAGTPQLQASSTGTFDTTILEPDVRSLDRSADADHPLEVTLVHILPMTSTTLAPRAAECVKPDQRTPEQRPDSACFGTQATKAQSHPGNGQRPRRGAQHVGGAGERREGEPARRRGR